MFIVILGGGIDLQGNLPAHVYQRLDRAIELYQKKPQTKIVVSGKYSFLYDADKPPTTEAEKMAQYVLSKNIDKKDVLLEKNSQDTISNAYYLKKNIFLPKKENQAVIITSHFHLERVKYVFQKIFGPKYRLEFIGLQEHLDESSEEKILQRQKELLLKTRIVLAKMKTGNHEFLKGKFYKIKYYREKRPGWVKNFVAQGK